MNELKKLKSERSKLVRELSDIGTEEQSMLAEKRAMSEKVESAKVELKNAPHSLSVREYDSLVDREAYYATVHDKIETRIGQLQFRRAEIHRDMQLISTRIFKLVLDQEAEQFRQTHLNDFLRLYCLARMAGGVGFEQLVSYVFSLNSPEVNARFKAMLSKMQSEMMQEAEKLND